MVIADIDVLTEREIGPVACSSGGHQATASASAFDALNFATFRAEQCQDALTPRLPSAARLHAPSEYEEGMTDTTDTVGVAGERIRSIIERVERIEEEIKDLMETKKEIFAEAKGEGLDVKVLKEILKLRKQDKDERDEQESLLEVYLRAMDAPAPVAQAA